ncbi:MAG: hypothetical protein R3F34_03325 [Planctomycetota bacterium]
MDIFVSGCTSLNASIATYDVTGFLGPVSNIRDDRGDQRLGQPGGLIDAMRPDHDSTRRHPSATRPLHPLAIAAVTIVGVGLVTAEQLAGDTRSAGEKVNALVDATASTGARPRDQASSPDLARRDGAARAATNGTGSARRRRLRTIRHDSS